MPAKVKPFEKYTAAALKAVDEGEQVPAHVYMPPALRENQDVQYIFKNKPPSIDQHLARIEAEADPIGLLIAIAIGQPVPEFTVREDGSVGVDFQTLPINNRYRMKAIEYLADKVMPSMTMSKKHTKKSDGSEAWEATLTAAAGRADSE